MSSLSTVLDSPPPSRSRMKADEMINHVNIPGMLNVFFGIYEAVISAEILSNSDWETAHERMLNATIRVIQSPLLILEAGCTLAFNIVKIVHTVKPFLAADSVLKPLGHTAAGLGLAICALEAFLEGLEIKRTIKFILRIKAPSLEMMSTRIKKFDEKCRHDEPSMIIQVQERLKKVVERRDYFETFLGQEAVAAAFAQLPNPHEIYFVNYRAWNDFLDDLECQVHLTTLRRVSTRFLDATNEERRYRLTDRVRPWLADKLDRKLPHIYSILENASLSAPEDVAKARLKTYKFTKHIQNQINKKITTHFLTALAIGFTVAGLIIGLTSAPYIIPLALIIVGMIFSISKPVFIIGVSDTRGWHIDWDNYRELLNELQAACRKLRDSLCCRATRVYGLFSGTPESGTAP